MLASAVAACGLMVMGQTPGPSSLNILPGYYVGTWTNTTFNVTGSLKGDVFVRNGVLTLALDIGGQVFGNPDPAPFVRSAPITPQGVTFHENGNPTFGDFTINISPGGTITISGTNVASPFVLGYDSSGTINGGLIQGSGIVHLEPSGSANGVATVARTVYSTLISDNQVASGNFGYAVAGIGDVDGDGRGDIIVGAPGETVNGLAGAGRAYIVSGATGNIIRSMTSPGPIAGGSFGAAVAAVPDTDGDKIPDLVIGAPDEHPGTNPVGTGRAYIYSGANGGLLRKLIPPIATANAHFGAAVGGAPDINGDGRGDVIVGAPDETYAGAPLNAGHAHIYSGATGLRIRTLAPAAPQARDFYGFSVAGIGDINGDGRGDFIIGSPESDENTLTGRPGHVYIISGATGLLLARLQSPGVQADGFFGYSVAAVPDVSGDGIPDIIVGSPWEHPGASPVNCGRANVFSGATRQLFVKLLPPTPVANGHFGFSVAGIPDLTGDGRGDIVVGAPGEPGNGAGRIHIYSGATGVRAATYASVYPDVNGNFGVSVGGVPDFSGNGRGDVVVGAWSENPASAPPAPSNAGRAYLIRK